MQAPRPIQLEAKPLPPPVPPKSRAVFGATKNSATDAKSAVEVKKGNTIAKTPDDLKLRPEDAEALPIPTDEYLVSEMPVLVADVRAVYPPEAKKKAIQGAVVFELLVDSRGIVREAKFLEGPGFGMNEAAAEAVKQLKFRPALVAEQPVAVKIRYTYRFVMEK